ncbi:uncharacterized protein FIBRA_04574 [Fibroporia radiculosa]|uniref:Uncharacterized protein n=1 Tax=Fibroporia radiculosa TaxID=599839 RepID=J4H313_9APHY|nr:uncharacterized protein FIBRA_04574 [Fibroporia radiculosa]CCM02474.1 predicted protein [Fibroporia radiculosa]
MPLGPVNVSGASLYYDDSLAPAGSTTYVTLVLIHGTMFSSAIFRKMIPFAIANDLRLVLLNLRDYPGSTRYTPEELQQLRSSNRDVQSTAIVTRGLEIAEFIRWFIETERIPPISEGSSPGRAFSGGFAVLGWSSGNCQTVPLLAHGDKVPAETRRLFNNYFRTFIFYDMSTTAMGEPAPAGLYSPFRDSTLSGEEKTAAFPLWVSSYWTQLTLPFAEDSESSEFAPVLLARTPANKGIDGSTKDDRYSLFAPTILRMSTQVFADVTDPSVMARSQFFFQHVDRTIYQENIRRAIFDCPLDGENIIWPKVKAHIVWCDMTTGDVAYASNRVKYLAKHYSEGAKNKRDLTFHKLAQANHFMHWDDPERLTKYLAGIV